MAEIVKECKKGSTSIKDGVTTQWWNVTTESGIEGTSKEEMQVGAECVATPGKEYKGKMQYWINPVKVKKGFGGGFSMKDPKAENKRTALTASVEFSKGKENVKSSDIIKVAEAFYKFLSENN